jgi:hypothetical protein
MVTPFFFKEKILGFGSFLLASVQDQRGMIKAYSCFRPSKTMGVV